MLDTNWENIQDANSLGQQTAVSNLFIRRASYELTEILGATYTRASMLEVLQIVGH